MKISAVVVALLMLLPVEAALRGQSNAIQRGLQRNLMSGSGSDDEEVIDEREDEEEESEEARRSGMRSRRKSKRRGRRRMRMRPITSTPEAIVAARLAPFLLQDGAEFDDDSSYQSCAWARTANRADIESASVPKTVQYYVLYSIYCATYAVPNFITSTDADIQAAGGTIPAWTVNTGWTDDSLDPCVCDQVNDAGYCEDVLWGIVCDPMTDQIVEINLSENNLSGSWPPEIQLLGPSGAGSLSTLDLYDNFYLFNNVDNSWIPLLGSIENLYFGYTSFAGNLPSLPSSLVEFDCQYSLVTGALTEDIFADATKLAYVSLDGNSYNSSIPLNVGNLEDLENFYAGNAFISGTLDFMQGLANSEIFELWVDQNPGLGGSLPTWLGDLDTLTSFSVTDCGLTGTLPTQLGDMDSMRDMWLYGNELVGTIPFEISRIPLLRTFQVEDNNLGGSMPVEVCFNREPIGSLEFLGADCDGEVSCDADCCTCCTRAECGDDDV